MKNRISRNDIGALILCIALLKVGLVCNQQAHELVLSRDMERFATQAMREAQKRADQAESRLHNIETGAVVPQASRIAIAEAVLVRGETILKPEFDEDSEPELVARERERQWHAKKADEAWMQQQAQERKGSNKGSNAAD